MLPNRRFDTNTLDAPNKPKRTQITNNQHIENYFAFKHIGSSSVSLPHRSPFLLSLSLGGNVKVKKFCLPESQEM
jgi:hypothetical protein